MQIMTLHVSKLLLKGGGRAHASRICGITSIAVANPSLISSLKKCDIRPAHTHNESGCHGEVFYLKL